MILPKQFFGFVGNENMILVNHGFSVQVLYSESRTVQCWDPTRMTRGERPAED